MAIFNMIGGGSLDVKISRKRLPAFTTEIKLDIDEEKILAFVLICLTEYGGTQTEPLYVICIDGIERIYTADDEYHNNNGKHTVTTTYTLKDGTLTLNKLDTGHPSILLTFYK